MAAAVLIGGACGSGETDTASDRSSTVVEESSTTAETAETASTGGPTSTTTEQEEPTTTTPTASETSSDTADDTTGGDELVPIESMAPSDVESLIEGIGCEIHPEFGRGSGMVAFFLGGFGPGGDPPVQADADTSFLCSTGGDLSIVGLAMNDSTDAKAMASWLASSDSGSCRDIGSAGSWTFLYATSENPPDTVRLPEVMALHGGEMEVTC